jgi:hypothetical protein
MTQVSRPSKAVVARAVGSAGVVAVLMSVVVGIPVFGLGGAGLSFLIVGGLLLVLAGLLLPNVGAAERARGRRTGLGLLAAALALLGGGVFFGAFVDVNIDITAARSNSLAEESLAVLAAADRAAAAADVGTAADVEVVSFVSTPRGQEELSTLVRRYQRLSKRLRFSPLSMQRPEDLDRARALGVAEYLALGGPDVVVVFREHPVRFRFQPGAPDQEAQLTNAIRRATSTRSSKIYVLAGQGEPDVVEAGPLGLSRLKTALQLRGVELVPLPLTLVGRLPDDAVALMIMPGLVPLPDAATTLLHTALNNDVSVFLAVDPDHASQAINALCAGVGVDVVDDVIVDDSPFSSMLGGADVATGQSNIAHTIVRPLQGALTHFPRANLLAITPIDDLTATPIVSTGAEARSRKTGAQGPLPLVVAIERAASTQRVVVAADADFVQNAHITQGANADLALNAMLWLSAVDDAIVVRPRTSGGTLVFFTPSGRSQLTFVVVLLVPALLAMAAAAWATLRRHR